MSTSTAAGFLMLPIAMASISRDLPFRLSRASSAISLKTPSSATTANAFPIVHFRLAADSGTAWNWPMSGRAAACLAQGTWIVAFCTGCWGATEQLWNAFHNCSVAPQHPATATPCAPSIRITRLSRRADTVLTNASATSRSPRRKLGLSMPPTRRKSTRTNPI
jgi:hypothetical protein